jgi:hypothetical protein
VTKRCLREIAQRDVVERAFAVANAARLLPLATKAFSAMRRRVTDGT